MHLKKKNLESVLDKMVFLSSDGASVNSGKKSGLIRMFQEDYEWICFIWCFSHRLELALKDSLKNFSILLMSLCITCTIFIKILPKNFVS